MKIHCTQPQLAKGIAIVQHAVASRATLPILGNILLEAKDEGLRLAATNLDISITCWIAAEVEIAGSITVPARLLGDIVSKLAPGKVALVDDAKTLSLQITCGNFKARLAGLDAADFPQTQTETPPSAWVMLEAASFGAMIDQVAFAATRDESRPALRCVQVSFGKRLTLAATDGFRLGVRSAPLAGDVPAREALVRATSLVELGRILTNADPDKPLLADASDGRRIVFALAGNSNFMRAQFTAQLVDARYPDYQAIIPKSHTTSVAVEGATLLRALQAARLFAKGDDQVVTLTANPGGCLQVSAKDDLMGASNDELDADIKGEAVTIAFNAGYLLDVVSRLSDAQIVLELAKATRPIGIRPAFASPDEFVHVIMPMNRSGKA